jgi:putative transcriptional regulator
LGAACLFLGSSLAAAQDLSRVLLLVATPDLEGPYHGTAVLVVPNGDQHMGFILNRAMDVKLAALFPDHAPSVKVADPVYFGGPEASNAIFAVVRRDPGKPSLHLFGDLYVTGDAKSINRVIEETPNDARYFVGFVGWLADELADEIAKGYWYVAEADAALVFRKDTGTMWEDLLRRVSQSGHAAVGAPKRL